jgi:1,2-diacylglycerol-3-alpha-glucose alpha-1,2-galactosyltransferase
MKLRVRLISESAFTVQGHGVHTAFVEMVNAMKARRDTQVIVNHRGRVDITHIHTIGMYSLWYLLFGSGKKVVSAHVVPESFVGSLVGAKYWLPLARLYIRWFYNQADVLIAVSESTKRSLLDLHVTARIEVVHNMIHTEHYRPKPQMKERARKALGIPTDAWVVIGAGQIQPRKGIDSFIRTARALPETTFYWIGGMPFGKAAADHSHMQKLIDTAPNNVHFPGTVVLDEMRQYYHMADAFFLPSVQETFGLVVIEAAASGLPVVLRDIPDYNETFRGDAMMVSETGFVAAFDQLRHNKKVYNDAKQKAHHIAKRFDSMTITEQIIGLYRELL